MHASSLALLLVALVAAFSCQAAAEQRRVTLDSSSSSSGPKYSFTAKLKGSNQNPAINTPASGTATVYWYNETYASGELLLSNLKDAFMGHIHHGNATTNGPVVSWAWASYLINATTGASNTSAWQYITIGQDHILLTWSFDPSAKDGGVTITQQLQTSTCYFNIHTKAHPSGEIRGQFVQDKDVKTPGKSLVASFCQDWKMHGSSRKMLGGMEDDAKYSFTAKLSGANEVPTAVASNVTSTATVYWYNDTYALGQFKVSYVTDAFMAHIHAGNATTSGPVVSWAWASRQPNATSGAPTSAWQYVQTGSTSIITSWAFDPSVQNNGKTITQMLMDSTCYFNIHTKLFPAGEVRGQFVQDKKMSSSGFKTSATCMSWSK